MQVRLILDIISVFSLALCIIQLNKIGLQKIKELEDI